MRWPALLLVVVCFVACARRQPHELDNVKAADVKKVTLEGGSVAAANNKVEITDPKDVASFLHAFQNRIVPPETGAADKINVMRFALSSGREVEVWIGQGSIQTELGPEMESVIRPYFKKD